MEKVTAADLRKRQGLTIEDCARVNGVKPRTWSRWERGLVKCRRPPEEKLKPLIDAASRFFHDGCVQSDIEDFIEKP